ncbi:MAG: hypothetical protein IKF97_06085 [Clostridia bacterium]|nr:hypothetical protein [Clostridia bacterium]
MNKKIKINYTNNKKINEMVEEEKKMAKLGFTFGGVAIFSEIGATIYAPDPLFSGITIASVIGLGVCVNKVMAIDKKIEHYIDSHKNL